MRADWWALTWQKLYIIKNRAGMCEVKWIMTTAEALAVEDGLWPAEHVAKDAHECEQHKKICLYKYIFAARTYAADFHVSVRELQDGEKEAEKGRRKSGSVVQDFMLK